MKARVIVACAAIIAILSGCGPAQPTTPATSSSQANSPTAQPPMAQPTPPPATAAPSPAVPTPPRSGVPAANWDEFSFDEVMTVGDQSLRSRWAVKKGKVRIEVEIMGQPVVFVGDRDGKVGYQWVRGQDQAVKMSYDDLEQAASAPPDLRELSVDAAMGSPAGTETVDGQSCDIYEVTGSAATLRVWVSRTNTLPIKSEITTAEGTVTTEYRNLKQGGLSDDLFEVPAGMKIVEPLVHQP